LLGKWGDYLTDKEKIHPQRFEEFMYHLAFFEEEHFKREENDPGWKLSAEAEQEPGDFYGIFYGGDPTPAAAVEANKRGSYPPVGSNSQPTGVELRSYRDVYYQSKLGWSNADRERTLFQRRALVRDYMEGLHWNLNYYHNGCQSWDWYFPHLYAPMATDFVNLDELYDLESDAIGNEQGFKALSFDAGQTFPPLAQLLSVLPPQSADLLPKPLGELMLHPSSPLINFYPNDFTSDPNGKRQPWEAVVKIPFIDANILLGTVNQILDQDKKKQDEGEDGLLSKAERMRNTRGSSAEFLAPEFGTVTTEEWAKQLTDMRGLGKPRDGRVQFKRKNNNNNRRARRRR